MSVSILFGPVLSYRLGSGALICEITAVSAEKIMFSSIELYLQWGKRCNSFNGVTSNGSMDPVSSLVYRVTNYTSKYCNIIWTGN